MSRAALVTGAAGGIGRAVAERLIGDGLDVLSVDLKADGLPGTPFEADLTTREGNKGAVDAALEAFGRLDVVVANAGVQHVAPVEEFPEDQWDLLIAIMLTSPFLLAKYAWPSLEEADEPRYIAIASAHGARRLALQVRLRVRQARRHRARAHARARGRRGRHLRHRRLPRLRPHAAGREPDPRPGEGARASPRRRRSSRSSSPRTRSSG